MTSSRLERLEAVYRQYTAIYRTDMSGAGAPSSSAPLSSPRFLEEETAQVQVPNAPRPHGRRINDSETDLYGTDLKLELPWSKVSGETRAPTGVQVCRYYGMKNHGPRVPKAGPKSRDQEPINYKDCPHTTTTHGGNGWAYYNQCDQCKIHLDYYPKEERGMARVIDQVIEWQAMEKIVLDELRKVRQEAKNQKAGKAEKKIDPGTESNLRETVRRAAATATQCKSLGSQQRSSSVTRNAATDTDWLQVESQEP